MATRNLKEDIFFSITRRSLNLCSSVALHYKRLKCRLIGALFKFEIVDDLTSDRMSERTRIHATKNIQGYHKG